MAELLTLPMKIEVSSGAFTNDLKQHPMKVHSQFLGLSPASGAPQAAKKAVRWGGAEGIAVGAAMPEQSGAPVQVVAVAQPVLIDLSPGRRARRDPPPGAGRASAGASTAAMRLGLATPKKVAAQSGAAGQELRFFHFPAGAHCPGPEEESTGCSGSEPESLPRAAAEDDSTPCSGHQSLGEEVPVGRRSTEPAPTTVQPPPGIPSVGSALHGSGMCQPCAWHWKPGGCAKAEGCRHCHICPPSELKARKKSKIQMLRMGLATPKSVAAPDGGFPPMLSPFGFMQGSVGCSDGAAPPAPWPVALPGAEALQQLGAPQPQTPTGEQDAPAPPVQLPPGLQGPASMHSVGSGLHGTGSCRPCAWFWKPGGCQKNQDCLHCHLCPEGEVKSRKVAKLSAMRQGVAALRASP